MPDFGTIAGQLQVGVATDGDDRTWVALETSIEVEEVLLLRPEFAVHLAQSLLKNARLAGYTGPFVELPTDSRTH